MVKRTTTLNLEDDYLKITKMRGINLSKLVNGFLKYYLEINDINAEEEKNLEIELLETQAKLTKLKNNRKEIKEKERQKKKKDKVETFKGYIPESTKPFPRIFVR